jgi:hypothetical protein
MNLPVFGAFFVFLVFSFRDFVLYRCAGSASGQISAARLQCRRGQHERYQEPSRVRFHRSILALFQVDSAKAQKPEDDQDDDDCTHDPDDSVHGLLPFTVTYVRLYHCMDAASVR